MRQLSLRVVLEDSHELSVVQLSVHGSFGHLFLSYVHQYRIYREILVAGEFRHTVGCYLQKHLICCVVVFELIGCVVAPRVVVDKLHSLRSDGLGFGYIMLENAESASHYSCRYGHSQ